VSSKIKVCLVGAGRAAKVHGSSIERYIPSAELSAVVDVNNAPLEENHE